MSRIGYVTVGILIGLALSLIKEEEPVPKYITDSELGALLAVTPGNTHEAISMAAAHCQWWKKYPGAHRDCGQDVGHHPL